MFMKIGAEEALICLKAWMNFAFFYSFRFRQFSLRMVNTDLPNDFEFPEYRLNESHTLSGDVVGVLSVVSPFVVRLGCNSFSGICAKCYFVEIGVGKAELCYGRK